MINSLKKLFQGGGTDSAGRYGATGGYEGGITRRLDLAGAAAESDVRVKVIGVGGGGWQRGRSDGERRDAGMEFLAVNTDVQALRRVKGVPTYAIGPMTTSGMGSGGNPDLGRKAVRENQEHIGELPGRFGHGVRHGRDGSGTGTGAASRGCRNSPSEGRSHCRRRHPTVFLRGSESNGRRR